MYTEKIEKKFNEWKVLPDNQKMVTEKAVQRHTSTMHAKMEVLKVEFNAMMRSKFSEIKLNHVNMFGAKVIHIRAMTLAADPEYIDM